MNNKKMYIFFILRITIKLLYKMIKKKMQTKKHSFVYSNRSREVREHNLKYTVKTSFV